MIVSIEWLLLPSDRLQHYPPGKSTLKSEAQEGGQPYPPQLYAFVASYSWCLFDLFNLGLEWLQLPPAQWNKDAELLRFKSVVSNVNVMNNPPKRAFRDVTDFASCCKDPDRREDEKLINFAHLTKDEIVNI